MSPLRRPRLALLLALLLTLLAACDEPLTAPTPVPKRTPVPGGGNPSGISRELPPPEEQTWLVMIYSDADDEVLEEDMFLDLNEAEIVGSTDRVKVVVQMDRFDGGFDGGGDWTSTKRFLLEQDDDLEELNSTELDDIGETNMADADTLIDFVTWAAKEYPSDRYALIMSDHGSGWPGGWNDPDPPTVGRHNIPLAQSFGDMLFLMEMEEALTAIMAETDIGQFDLIGFDACLMGGLEVFTAMAPFARYSVASQEIEPSLGWAYGAFLAYLADQPEVDGGDLANAIVNSYIEQDQQIIDDDARAKYVERVYDYDGETTAEEVAEQELATITLSAVNLQAVPDVLDALDALVRTLEGVRQKDVAAARSYAQAFESVFDPEQPSPYIDLGHFAKLIKKRVDNPEVQAAADELLAAIDRAVIAEKAGDEKKGASGISIHFPNSELYQAEESGYETYNLIANSFARQSLWDDYLSFHYTGEDLPAVNAEPDEPAEPEEVVDAPGTGEITVAPIELSDTEVTQDSPVTIASTVRGDNIAFVYLFIGLLDEEQNAIQIIDLDYMDADDVQEEDGVFYPDWGEGVDLELEFDWDTTAFALNDGDDFYMAMLQPEEYGASPEEAIYSVEGLYVSAKSGKERRALLLLQDGELIQVLAFTGKENGSMSEVTPKNGDTFTIYDQWISLEDGEIFLTEGETLTFGREGVFWEEIWAPEGEYVVGFIAEDFDGNWYESFEQLTAR